jgi:hypothetical protein
VHFWFTITVTFTTRRLLPTGQKTTPQRCAADPHTLDFALSPFCNDAQHFKLFSAARVDISIAMDMEIDDLSTHRHPLRSLTSDKCKIKPLPPDFAVSEIANRQPLIPPTPMRDILDKMKVSSLTDAYKENR